MSYISKEIKQGIKLHCIDTKIFKTNLLAVFITTKLEKDTVTANALIPAVLRMGTKELDTQEKISMELENMYGATFNCGIDKVGDNQVIKFYLESLNDKYLPKGEKITKRSIELLIDIIFNPLIKGNEFFEEYVVTEKNNLKMIIEGKIDNKDRYAFNRCIEEMYKDKPYGLYKYGSVEELENITSENLYNQYQNLIKNAKIDIFFSGDIENESIENIIEQNLYIRELQTRDVKYQEAENENQTKEVSEIEEKMDITQGKLVIGLDVNSKVENHKYIARLYNVILGESATSKLFQNVREKASLAYSASSNYIKQKNNIFVRCGIEIQNYNKAIEIIKQQLEDMKQGNFTKEEFSNAKKYIVSGINTVKEEQDSELTYYLGQELSGEYTTFEQYVENINKIDKKDVEDLAKLININTIYFLKK